MDRGLVQQLLSVGLIAFVGGSLTTFVQAGDPRVQRLLQAGIGIVSLALMAKVSGLV